MKSAAQRTTMIASLLWSVPAWEVTWYWAAVIGDLRVCSSVLSQMEFLEWQSGSSYVSRNHLTHYRQTSLSLSLTLLQPNCGVAEASRGWHRVEGGGVDLDKITSSSWSRSKLGLIQFFYLVFDTETESWLGISPSRVDSSAVCVFYIGIWSDGVILSVCKPVRSWGRSFTSRSTGRYNLIRQLRAIEELNCESSDG